MIHKCICIYTTLNNAELSNGRRRLTATFAKCNLLKWNTLYTHYDFTRCAIIFFSAGIFGEDSIQVHYGNVFLLHLTFT